jgi:hypothetical protein
MKSYKYNYNLKYVIFGHIVLFIIFLGGLKEENTTGLERIIVTFILSLIIAYGITLNFKKSFITAISFTLLVGLLDNKGPFNDYITEFSRYQTYASNRFYIKDFGNTVNKQFVNKYENFDIKPAGELAEDKGNSYSPSKTENNDNIDYNDEDLDKILIDDEKQGIDENEHLKQAGGGLDQLKNLIDMAKKESPYSNNTNNTTDYTPAQAQRATFHLIDTVTQLKQTMTEMMPLMKAGKTLMGLHQKMGGDELTNSLKN